MSIVQRYWTYTELLSKVEKDLDLEDEDFIQPEEMLGYFNDAVDEAEQEVHTLHEDYFLDNDTITLVNGTNSYDMPTRIYGFKIRAIVYRNGSIVQEIPKVRDFKKLLNIELDTSTGPASTGQYSYYILNQSAGSPKIIFTPAVVEDGAYMKVWFLRQANRFVNVSDVLDVPEAAKFVMAYVKVQCYLKEGHPNLVKATADLEKERMLLQGTLRDMTPDEDTMLEMDLTFYGDMN